MSDQMSDHLDEHSSLVKLHAASFGLHEPEAFEQALIKRILADDESAARELIDRHKERLIHSLAYILGDLEEAQDVALEACTQALKHLSRFEGRSGFYTWLYKIAWNLCANRRTRKSSQKEVTLSEALSPVPLAEQGDIDKTLLVRQLLARLAGLDRAILILTDMQGFSGSETGHILGIPLWEVYYKRSRAHAQFRSLWAQAEEEADHV